MRILVTGGAGFIGSHTVDALLAAGHRVRVLDNFSAGTPANLPQHPLVDVVRGDIGDRPTVRAALDGVDRVLHLAAQVSVQASVKDPVASAQQNVTGFLHVLDAARAARIKRFVYASSAAVYGHPERLPLTETSTARPASPYGLEKLINDQYAALYGALFGISCLGLRYFNVYGPRQNPDSPYAGVLSKWQARLAANASLLVYGDGLQTRDFIYVGDVAQANLRALHSDVSGVLNIASGRSVTLLDLIASMQSVTRRTLAVEHAPRPDGDIVHSTADNRRMLEALGDIAFTPLADGLTQLLA